MDITNIVSPGASYTPEAVPPEQITNEKKEMIGEFEQLATLMSQFPHSDIDLSQGIYQIQKDALAFLVDSMKNVNGNNWKFLLQGIKQQISNSLEKNPLNNAEGAEIEASWIINKSIYDLYMQVIQSELKHAIENNNQTHAKLLNNIAQLNMKFHRIDVANHEKGQRVSFGGIDRTLLPQWYKEKYINEDIADIDHIAQKTITSRAHL